MEKRFGWKEIRLIHVEGGAFEWRGTAALGGLSNSGLPL